MAYTKTEWKTGDPITQERMNHIEDGIDAAQSSADNALKVDSPVLTNLSNKVNEVSTIVGEDDAHGIRRQIIDLNTTVNQAAGADSPGAKAWTQIVGATTNIAGRDDSYDNLDSRFYNVEQTVQNERGFRIANTTQITGAMRNSSDSLVQRFQDVEGNVNTVSGMINTLNTTLTNASAGHASLAARLTSDETRISSVEQEILDAHGSNNTYPSLTNRFEVIQTELQNARSSHALAKDGADKVYNSVDERIEAIEAEMVGTTDMATRIDTIQNNMDGIANQKINLSAIENNLNTVDTTADHVLDARQGRVLKEMINSVDTTYKSADTALDTRISAIETNINDAKVENGPQTLDARFDAVENRATQLESDLSTIAAELDMIDDGAIVAVGSRVDNIEYTLDHTATQGDDTTGLQQHMAEAESAIAALNTTIGADDTAGLRKRITDLEDDVNDATSGLVATKAIADAAATSADLTALAGRVTTLENNPVSATVIVSSVTYNNDGIPTSIQDPSTDVDYLLKKDDKYYYWKYINNKWELISGGGSGSGTSSAEFYSTLTDINDPVDTVDYFIGTGTSYIHYRWLNNQWVTILPEHLINHVSVDTSPVSEEANAPRKSRPIVRELGSNTNLLAGFNAIQSFAAESVEDGYKLTWINIDGEVADITITGGGGSSSSANASITRITGATTNGALTTISGENCEIEFAFTATDSNGDTLATTSTGTWFINRARVATSTVNIGNNIFNITPYLHTGDNNITLSVETNVDDQIITRTKTWMITVVNFSLEWDYDESIIQEDSTINFSCIPYGIDITKTLHLKVGTHEQTQTVTTSGIPTTVTLTNNFTHGNYTAEMWMTATINGQPKETDHITHDFIVAEVGNNNPIIAATLPAAQMDQYNTISIPFVVYTPTSNISTVELAVDGVVLDTREVGRNGQIWHYTPSTSGVKTLTITSGSVTKTLTLTVNAININNLVEIPSYAFKLKASEITSNNALQAWYYDSNNQNNTKLQFSQNFDWVNGGIQTEMDENNQLRQYIRIKSGTTMTIPYKMFATDPRENGVNFKIIFKVENCRDYDAVIATNIAENIGIQLSAHGAMFKSTATQINTQYGEEEYTELEFEVYKSLLPNGTDAPDQYMMAWIDGVITTARAYGGNFVQTSANAANLVIGSNNCDVCIYLIKYYPFVLSRNDHITNFIADAPNAVEMIKRYNRNDILDADEDIDYNKLAQKNPDCRVWLYDIDRMTKAKDDAITVHQFQQIWENGDQYYQLQGTNAKLKIQGTSSFNYRYGAANTDIDFGKKKAPDATLYDGYGNNLLDENLEYPGFKINDDSLPITYSNTKVNFASCEQVNNMCNAEWYQRYQPFPSLSARDCMEFAMGVQFIKDRHNEEPSDGIVLFTEKGADFDPEKYYMYSIANMGTSKKNTHIFHSENECCIEIKENTSDAQKMKSFDSAWTANDSNTQNYEMRYPDLKPTKVTTDIKDGWERFVTWMVASNPGAALEPGYVAQQLPTPVTFEPYTFRGHNREVTNVEGRHFEQVLRGKTVSQYAGTYTHDTFEYRMAKMLSECEDYMAMDSVIYHFCFIERHTMVDNVAKNTFWSSVKEVGGPNNEEGYWIWDLSKNYDNDTSDGNNNNGLLVFDYGNEANDTRDGTPVFNGHDAVWFVFASNLYEACREMFTNRETIGAWSSTAYHNYLLNEQRKVPERVWNECYWYDYLRTYEQALGGDTNVQSTWINFLDGGQKIHQRNHYETYEEIYDSSKYRGSLSHNQSITLRGEAIDYQTLNLPAQESKFEITMFNKCYLTIWIGTNFQTVKCEKGVPITMYFYEDNDPSKGYMSLANSVIDIDSGSMVQAIGDLSRIYPSSGQFGAAKRLRSLQIGSDTAGYYNPNMNNNSILTFNNKMLEYLYVQNLPQATYNLDLSNCPELKYLKASGSGFTGFVFANGGLLNEAYINAPASLVMRNLNELTKANFHLTDPTAVTSLRLENCKLFDNFTFINELTNISTLRLTNINWTLSDSTLLDNLLTLQGINESGLTIPQSYLSGNVSLTGTVYGGDYNEYLNAWSPDLTIDISHASEYIPQHLVTYRDEDGTILYTKYIDHDTNFIDIVATQEISAPSKAADVQYQYIFGSLQYSQYRPYSGWRLSTDSLSIYETYGANPNIRITGPIDVYAVYTGQLQQYIVNWIVDNKSVAQSELQNYGGGYNLASPTIKEVQNANANTYTFINHGDGTCSYRIMTGWDKLPTNITPTTINSTYDIHATWLERNHIDYMAALDSNDYSVEEKLLILKNIQGARNTLAIQDIFPVQLGYDGIKAPINLLAAPKRYTGVADSPITTYTPFGLNKSFTIAIDYRFEHITSDSANEAVLLSCYSDTNDSIQGFKLFYNPRTINTNPVPQISFGNTATSSEDNVYSIGSSIANRGMVVLRHRAGESILYVYSGSTNSGLLTEYSMNDFRKTLTWSGATSNAKLILGGISSSSTTSINAHGTLYSVKYWEEDLGEGECVQIANWCHETMNFALQDFTENSVHSALPIQGANLVLHTLNASEMGQITDALINNTTENSVGWDPSVMRTFYNSRLYQALPIKLQSIMSAVPIIHVKAYKNEGGYSIGQDNATTLDYVFAPSYREVGIDGDAGYYASESRGPFPWAGVKVMQYSNGRFIETSQNVSRYNNLRFKYAPIAINANTRIFIDYPTTNNISFEDYAAQQALNLRTGDILITNQGGSAYIYISGTDVISGAPFILNGDSYLSTSIGAWIESTSWWTRSVASSGMTNKQSTRLISISQLGIPRDNNFRTNGLVYSIAL